MRRFVVVVVALVVGVGLPSVVLGADSGARAASGVAGAVAGSAPGVAVGQVDISFFYNELSDFQVLEFTGTQFQTFNVDDVTAKGVEAELFAQWNPYVSSSLSASYTDASYGDNCDASFIAAGGA